MYISAPALGARRRQRSTRCRRSSHLNSSLCMPCRMSSASRPSFWTWTAHAASATAQSPSRAFPSSAASATAVFVRALPTRSRAAPCAPPTRRAADSHEECPVAVLRAMLRPPRHRWRNPRLKTAHLALRCRSPPPLASYLYAVSSVPMCTKCYFQD